MSLIGRAEEIRLIHRLCAAWERGRSAVVTIAGAVGSGKTAMLRVVAETVGQGGLFVSVTATASERSYPFNVVDQLIHALCAVGMPDPGLGGVGKTTPTRWRQDAGVLRRRLSDAICAFAVDRRIVVAIDDMQYVDGPSLLCLSHLIHRLERTGILVVLTENPAYERDLGALHAETAGLPYYHRIRLEPLTRDSAAELLTERLGAPPPAAFLDLCARAGGGNPVLLQALLEDCTAADGNAAPGLAVPGAAYRQAVLRCLNRCEPQAVAVARAIALLRDSAAPALITDFLGVDPVSVRAALLALRGAGLLVADRFRHEEARMTVLTGIPLDALPAMHVHAAELLYRIGEPAAAVADQLIAARDLVEEGWRLTVLADAAREAMTAGDASRAIAYLRYAADLCTDKARRAELTARLAEAQWHLDPATADRHLDELRDAVRAGQLTGPDSLVPVRLLLWRGEFAEADDLLAAAAAVDGGPQVDLPRGGMLAELWNVFCLGGSASTDRDEEISGSRLSHAVAWSGMAAAPMYVNVAIEPTGGPPGAERLLPGLHAEGSLASLLFALGMTIQRGLPDEASAWARRLTEAPWIRGLPMRRVLFEVIAAEAALRIGNLDEAHDLIRGVLSQVAPHSWGVAVGLPIGLAIRIAIERGDTREASSYLTHPIPEAMFSTPFALPYLSAVGHFHLNMGDAHTALTHFLSARDLLPERGRGRTVIGWRNDGAAALLALGRTQQAREYAEDLLSRVEDDLTRGIALRRLAAAGPSADRITLLTEAVSLLERCGARLEATKARAELASEVSAASSPAAQPFVGPPQVSPLSDATRRTLRGPVSGNPFFGRPSARRSFTEQPDTEQSGGERSGSGRPGARRRGADRGAAGPPTGGPPSGRPAPGLPSTDQRPASRVSQPGHESVHSGLRAAGGAAGSAGETVPWWTGLTGAERRVAVLAAGGATNRQISDRLFITVSTVEQHLTKVYRKLHVRSRSGLKRHVHPPASD